MTVPSVTFTADTYNYMAIKLEDEIKISYLIF
jgi:hypothetical protein